MHHRSVSCPHFFENCFFDFGRCGPSDGQATAVLEAQCVYYIQLDKEASLPHLRRSCFSKGSLQVVNIPGKKPCIPGGKLYIMEKSYGGHFLHKLSTFILRSKEGFAIPMSFYTPIGLRHWSLTCPWGWNIGSWHANLQVNSTHPLRTYHAQGFLHALYLGDTGKIEKSPSGQ